MNEMSRKIPGITLACICALVILSGVRTVRADAPLFVVYGTILNEYNGAPVDGGYIVTVTNIDRDISQEVELGSGPDAGKFCVVFMNYEGGIAVSLGDEITVSARVQYLQGGLSDLQPAGALEAIIVTEDDIEYMKMYVEIVIVAISVESKSWGAIKALFRE